MSDGGGNGLLVWQDRRNGNDDLYAAKITPDGQTPWGANGRLVCGAANGQQRPSLCMDGAGGCYVAWQDERGAVFYDLYIQRLDETGAAQFAADGLPLCVAAEDQEQLQLTPSWNGTTIDGCLAVWEDLRANSLVKEIYVQKVVPAGVLWATNGLKLSGDANPDPDNPTGATRQQPHLVSDHAGGLACIWEDARNTDGATFDLYAGRVLAEGTLSWGGLSGTLVAEGPGSQCAAQPRYLSGTGIGIAYDDQHTGSGSLTLQTLDLATGSPLLAPAGVVLVSSIDGPAQTPKVVSMSDGRAGMVWKDYRLANPVLYYQIVNAAGESKRAASGERLMPDNEDSVRLTQENPRLAPDGNGGFFVACEDLRTGHRAIRLQRVTAAGELACTAAARLVYSDATITDQKDAFIAPDGEGGCYIAWSNLNGNYIPDVYVMRLDANCQPAAGWNDPIHLTDTPQGDEAVQGLVTVPGGCFALWRHGEWNQYYLSGARVAADATVTRCDSISHLSNWSAWDAQTLAVDGAGGVYVVFEDQRVPGRDLDLFAQRIDAAGEELWTHGGITVISDSLLQINPQLAVDPQGNLCVAWEDFRNGSTMDLYMQKFSPDGERQWEAQGRLLCGALQDQSGLRLVTDGADGFFATWSDRRDFTNELYSSVIYGQHLTAEGEVAADDPYWVAGGSPLASTAHPQFDPAVALIGGEVVVAYEQDAAVSEEPNFNLHAQRLRLSVPFASDPLAAALPATFALHAAYPNPFNPTTTIGFELPRASRVKLVVFDLLGREVAVLADQTLRRRILCARVRRHLAFIRRLLLPPRGGLLLANAQTGLAQVSLELARQIEGINARSLVRARRSRRAALSRTGRDAHRCGGRCGLVCRRGIAGQLCGGAGFERACYGGRHRARGGVLPRARRRPSR